MPTHNFTRPQGRLVEITVESRALKDNWLDDPHARTAAVYLPPGYDADAPGGFPLFVALAAFGGSGYKLLNWQSFGESLPQRLDRLISEGEMGPVVLVMPDGFTKLGGNQWIDSAAMGRWEAFVLDELIPAVEAEFNVAPGPDHRAVFGHSSGGYAALIHAMKHGERWGAVASHSGDVGFELVYGRDEPRWSRWLAHDPLELADDPETIASMKRLGGLYLDCGSRDEYFIHFGSRALVRKLVDAEVEHVYQEFDGGHSGVSHRLDVSLPFLYRALTD